MKVKQIHTDSTDPIKDFSNPVKDFSMCKKSTQQRKQQHQQEPSNGVMKSIHNGWVNFTNCVRENICRGVVSLSVLSARYPVHCIVTVIVVSIALLVIGVLTNFQLNVDSTMLFTPTGSRALAHKQWLDTHLESGDSSGVLTMLVHADGNNVLHQKGVFKLFQTIDTIKKIPNYDSICKMGSYHTTTGEHTCRISSLTRFWGHNITDFMVNVRRDEDVIKTVSQSEYPDGVPADHGFVMLQSQRGGSDGNQITSANAFMAMISFPYTRIPYDELMAFEREVSDILLKIRDDWEHDEYSDVKLEFFTRTSYEDEFMRAIANDAPLLPMVFFIMIVFTMLVFYKRSSLVESRSMLGFGGVVTILLSIMSGYGLLFTLGIPLTPMTNILPFIMFGIGLDDTFIIAGEYTRHAHIKNTVERVKITMETCSLSISTTTATTFLAFLLGRISTVPAIYWLCMYAFPVVFIDYLYQVTFFIALIVLDERRLQAKKLDCCLCCFTTSRTDESIGTEPNQEDETICDTNQQQEQVVDDVPHDDEECNHFADNIMKWYADKLMQPMVKIVVTILFVGYFLACCHSVTLMEQDFEFTDLVPNDSYIKTFSDATNTYSKKHVRSFIYFRDVDQSDPEVQNQMIDYIDELVDIPEFSEPPPFCWVRDLQQYLALDDEPKWFDLSFNEQLDLLLKNPIIKEVYGDDIIRDPETGDIIASRCVIFLENVHLSNVQQQINALTGQRHVSALQPINENRKDWAFFTYDVLYFIWDFYNNCIRELISTTISAIVAVAIVSMLLLPHWTAVGLVLPTICVLYIDLIGTMQFIGLRINVISYIALVVAIGLMVDFIMHIVLRYYESKGNTREEKVKESLRTMGASILLGGMSTCLSSIPLLFSTSNILGTIFDTFFAMVILSLAHGLILLPVILSWCGTTDLIHVHNASADEHDAQNVEIETGGSGDSSVTDTVLPTPREDVIVPEEINPC